MQPLRYAYTLSLTTNPPKKILFIILNPLARMYQVSTYLPPLHSARGSLHPHPYNIT